MDADVQQTLLKLVAKVESMENNIDIKLQSVNDKILNMEERMLGKLELREQKVQSLEQTLCDHTADEKKLLEAAASLEAHKEKFDIALVTIKDHETRITILENAAEKRKSKLVDDFLGAIRSTFYTAFALGAVSFLGWQLLRWLQGK